MAIRILYYSLTGKTERVCRAVASRLNAEIFALEAPAVRRGLWGMFIWGYRALFKRHTEIIAPDADYAGADVLILGAQVWAGRLSVPVQTWLEGKPDLPERVALVITSGDKKYPDVAVSQFVNLSDRDPVAVLHVSEADFADATDTAKSAVFCAEVTKLVGQNRNRNANPATGAGS